MENTREARDRLEAMTLRMFSIFFSIMAILVLIGPFWSRERPVVDKTAQVAPVERQHATTIVSVVTATIFLSIAGGMFFFSHRIHRKLLRPQQTIKQRDSRNA